MNPFPSKHQTKTSVAQPTTMPARSAGVVAAVPGLSMAHNRPQNNQWKLSVSTDGSLCELKCITDKIILAKQPAKRGKIKAFSRASRGRLLKAIGRLQRTKLPVFVTLTYPDDFPVTPARWHRDLAALWRRIRRQWPEAAAIWK